MRLNQNSEAVSVKSKQCLDELDTTNYEASQQTRLTLQLIPLFCFEFFFPTNLTNNVQHVTVISKI